MRVGASRHHFTGHWMYCSTSARHWRFPKSSRISSKWLRIWGVKPDSVCLLINWYTDWFLMHFGGMCGVFLQEATCYCSSSLSSLRRLLHTFCNGSLKAMTHRWFWPDSMEKWFWSLPTRGTTASLCQPAYALFSFCVFTFPVNPWQIWACVWQCFSFLS